MLNDNADLRWNICTAAEELVIENEGNTVFFSSHILDVVENLCTRCCIIKSGRLEGVYDLKELKSRGESLEEIFMSVIGEIEEVAE